MERIGSKMKVEGREVVRVKPPMGPAKRMSSVISLVQFYSPNEIRRYTLDKNRIREEADGSFRIQGYFSYHPIMKDPKYYQTKFFERHAQRLKKVGLKPQNQAA